MKKNVMLSLVAMTSASMGAYADADLTAQIEMGAPADWGASEGLEINDGVLASTGVPVEQTIKGLYPGSYKLTAATKGDNVKLSVNGTELPADGAFILNEVGDVVIKAESTDGKSFTVGGFKLILDYNFAAAYRTLSTRLSGAYSQLDAMSKDAWVQELLKQYNETLSGDIEKVRDDIDGQPATAYDVYVEMELYKGVDESKIGAAIAQFATDVTDANANLAAKNYAESVIVTLRSNLATLQALLDGATQYAKGKHSGTVAAINQDIDGFATNVTTAHEARNAATVFTAEIVDGKDKELNGRIAEATVAINTADKNDKAYVAVTELISTARTAYQDALQALITKLEGEVYSVMLSTAQTELTPIYNVIAEAERLNGTKDVHDVAAENEAANTAALSTITSQVNIIQTKYEGKYDANEEAKEIADAAVKALNDRLETAKESLGDNTDYDNTVTDIGNSISKLQYDIDAQYKVYTLSAFDYTGQKAAIEAALTKLEAAAKPIMDNNNANTALTALLGEVKEALDAANEEVAKLVSEDGVFNGPDSWKTTAEGLQTKIEDYTTGLSEAYDAGEASRYFADNEADIEGLKTDIEAYKAEVESAFEKYNEITAAIAQYTEEHKAKVALVGADDAVTDASGVAYGTTLDGIKADIDAVSKALAEAFEKTDGELAAALEAVDTNADIATALAAITEEQFAADKATWESTITVTAVEKQIVYQQGRSDEVSAALDDFKEKYTEDVLGLKYQGVMDEFAEIQNAYDAVSIPTDQVTADNAGDLRKTLNEINTTFVGIESSLSTLEGKADEYAKAVKANNDALRRVNATISALTIKAAAIKSNNKDTSRDTEFEALYDEVTDAIEEQNDAVEVAYKAETLVVALAGNDEEEGINAILMGIDELITEYSDKATASATNYNAYTEQNKTVEDANLLELISTAKTNVNSVATGAGATYYIVLLDGYADDVAALNADIEKWYGEDLRESAEHTSEVTKRVNDLKENIGTSETTGVAKLAAENEAAHLKQLEALETTQNQWNEKYGLISAGDKSSQIQDYLDNLTAIQVKINDLSATAETDFANGYSAASAAVSGYSALQNYINTLYSKWESTYNAAIDADNAGRYELFTTTIGITKNTYQMVVRNIASFGNITNEEYQVAIEGILEANKTLYGYNAAITELQAKADNEHAAVVSPELYDADSLNIKAAKDLTAKIELTYKEFTDAANAKAKELYMEKMTEAEQQLDGALATLIGYSDEVTANAFGYIRSIIKEAKTIENSTELAVLLDKHLNALATIPSLIPAGQETAAQAEYAVVKTGLMAKIDVDIEMLESFDYAENVEGDYLADYKACMETFITGETAAWAIGDAALSNNNMFGENLEKVKALVDNFNNNNKFDEAKQKAETNTQSRAGYEEIQKVLNDLNELLGTFSSYAGAYFVDDTWTTQAQKAIDAQMVLADGALLVGEAHLQKDDILAEFERIKDNIKNYYQLADGAEYAALLAEISVLKGDYNQAVAAGSDEDLSGYVTTIANYEKRLDEINADDYEGDKHNAFILLEQGIAHTRTELANIYNENLVENTYNMLIKALDAVFEKLAAEESDLGGCHANVHAKYAVALADLKDKAETVRDRVDNNKANSTLLFYNDNLTADVTAIAAELTTIATAIDDMQAPYTANENAYVRLTGELEDLEGKRDALVDKIRGYGYVDQEAFAQSVEDMITALLNEDRDAVETAHSAADVEDMLTAGSTLTNAGTVLTNMSVLEEFASCTEADGRVNTLGDAFSAVKLEIAGYRYSEEAKAEIDELTSGISSAITALRKYNVDSQSSYIYKDIDGNGLTDDEGNVINGKSIDFVAEAVPEIFAKVEELTGKVKALSAYAAENSYILGDVNGDRQVMINDYMAILNHILEIDGAEIAEGSVPFLAADVNNDGSINVGDLTLEVQIINNTYVSNARMAPRRNAASSGDAIALTAEGEGTQQRIAISLNASQTYVGCQMDITLPAGVTLSGESLGSNADGLTLNSNDLGNGKHRIVVSSLDGASFADGIGTIILLDVEVAHSYSGQGVEVTDIMFADAAARVYRFNDIAGSEATGISTVSVGEAVKSKIYSVGGKLMDGLKRGVNIIRNNDGSTKKVIVK